jgi:hypothetical protein
VYLNMSLIVDAYLRVLAIQAHMFGQMLRGESTSFPAARGMVRAELGVCDQCGQQRPFCDDPSKAEPAV